MNRKCNIDIETYSAKNLLKAGVYAYAEDPSTEILTVCWSVDDGPVERWAFWHENPAALDRFADVLADPDIELRAYNAQFERVMLNSEAGQVLGLPHTPIERWRCTAVTAALHALPRAMGDCAKALGTAPKDETGKKIMLKLSKPRSSGKLKGRRYLYEELPDEFETLLQYNADDVVCEQGIDNFLPKIPQHVQATYHLDQKINDTGIKVDLDLVRFIVGEWPKVKAELDAKCRKITKGVGVTQVKGLTEWCGMDNLRAEEIRDTLASGKINVYEVVLGENGEPTDEKQVVDQVKLKKKVRKVLELRQEASKTSVTKFQTLLIAVCKDGRLRGMFLFHGAQTGRWTGKIVQLHNLPRNTAENPQELIEALYHGEIQLTGDIAQQLIRPTFIGGPDLEIGDFASIELRVALWLVNDHKALEKIRTGQDMYKDLATKIYDKPEEEITKPERFVGKQAVLGLGYGMGPTKFIAYCAGQGEPITEELAQYTVTLYRKVYKKIYDMWWNIEEAAITAIRNPGRKVPTCHGKIHYLMRGSFLYCIFPSGRPVCYPFAKVVPRMAPWGKPVDSLVFKGPNPKTGRWVERDTFGGRLFENICQGVAADLLHHSLHAVDALGYPIVGHVHDEIVVEGPEDGLQLFEATMAQTPEWANGCPVAVEAEVSPRYKK
jgi:DNA polymerase